jgi:hypothetical protein
MPVAQPFRVVFATSAVTLACSAGLLTLLKSVLFSECPAPVRPVAIACVAATALCLVVSAAYLVKSRAWTQAAAISSKWQPVYFVIVTVQRLILRAIVTYAVSAASWHTDSCSEYESAVHAISLMWNCAVLMTALSTMCCDTAADMSPRLRRCAYGLLALVLLLDTIGSVVWGNPLASDASLSVTANFSIFLDNQLTSTIASQVVLALHFLYVACRSRHGRGWAYASLRFELDECGKSLSMSMMPAMTSSLKDSGATASAATPMLALDASAPTELQHAGAARWNALPRLRQRWLQFQQRQVLRCRVFVVPCVAMLDAGGGQAVFALARPALDFRWLRPLQRIADAHPRLYVGFGLFFVALPSFAISVFSVQSQEKGIPTFVLNFLMCIMMLGFLSSKRYGLDRVAVRHVALSFRFAIFVTLLAADVALTIGEVFTILDRHPTSAVAYTFTVLFFCMCILLDCSPQLPPMVQSYISVRAHNVPMKSLFPKQLCRLDYARILDIGCCRNFDLYFPVAIQISAASSISGRTRFLSPLKGFPFTAASCC